MDWCTGEVAGSTQVMGITDLRADLFYSAFDESSA